MIAAVGRRRTSSRPLLPYVMLDPMPSIKVSVQAEPRDLESWLSLARRLEAGGFEALLMGDHPGAGASPWPALGSAAAVTSTLKLGTNVLQAGVREPVQTAADAATLDILAPGRPAGTGCRPHVPGMGSERVSAPLGCRSRRSLG